MPSFTSDHLSIWGAGRTAIDDQFGFEFSKDFSFELDWDVALGAGLEFTNTAILTGGASAWALLDLAEGSAQLQHELNWADAFAISGDQVRIDTSELSFGLARAVTDAPSLSIDIGASAHFELNASSRLQWSYAGIDVEFFDFSAAQNGNMDFNILQAEADLADPLSASIESDFFEDEGELTGAALAEFLAEWAEENSSHPWYSLSLGLPQLPDGELTLAPSHEGLSGRHVADEAFYEGRVDLDSIIQTAVLFASTGQYRQFDALEFDLAIDVDRDGSVEVEGSAIDAFLPDSIRHLLDEGVEVPLPWWLKQEVAEGEAPDDLIDLDIELALLDLELFTDARLAQDIHFIAEGIELKGTRGGQSFTEKVLLGDISSLALTDFDAGVEFGIFGQYWAETGVLFDMGLDLELLSVAYDLGFQFGELELGVDGAFAGYSETLVSLQGLGIEPKLAWTSDPSEVTLWGHGTFDLDELLNGVAEGGSARQSPVEIRLEDPDTDDIPPEEVEPPADTPPPPLTESGATFADSLSPTDQYDQFELGISAGTYVDIDVDISFVSASFPVRPNEVELWLIDADGIIRTKFDAYDIPGGQIYVDHDIEKIGVWRSNYGEAFDYQIDIVPLEQNDAEPGRPDQIVDRAPLLRQTDLVQVSGNRAEDGYENAQIVTTFNAGALTGFAVVYDADDVDGEKENILHTPFEEDGSIETARVDLRDFDTLDDSDDRDDDEFHVSTASNRKVDAVRLVAYAADDDDRGWGIFLQVSTDNQPEFADSGPFDRSLPVYLSENPPTTKDPNQDTHPVIVAGGSTAYDPDVALHDDGSVAVAYRAGSEMYVHFFDSDYAPVGGTPARIALGFSPHHTSSSRGYGPALTLNDEGEAIVAGRTGTDQLGVKLVTPEGIQGGITLSGVRFGGQYDYAIDTLADGRIIIAWDSAGGVRAQIWSGDLSSGGEIIDVSSGMDTASASRQIAVEAMPNGDFVIIYDGGQDDFTNQDLDSPILGRLYRNDGQARTDTFLVAENADSKSLPDVRHLGGTEFAVAFESESDDAIRLRHFAYDTYATGSDTFDTTVTSDNLVTIDEASIFKAAAAGDGDVLQLLGTPAYNAAEVTVSRDDSGVWTFEPVDGFTGETSVSFEVWDGVRDVPTGALQSGTVTINLTVEPPAPAQNPALPPLQWSRALEEGGTIALDYTLVGIDLSAVDADTGFITIRLANGVEIWSTELGEPLETDVRFADLEAGHLVLRHDGSETKPALILEASWQEGGTAFTRTVLTEFDYTALNDDPTHVQLTTATLSEGEAGRAVSQINLTDPDDTEHVIRLEAPTLEALLEPGSASGLDYLAWDAATGQLVTTAPVYFMAGQTLVFDVVAADPSGAEARTSVTLQITENRAAKRPGDIDEDGNATPKKYSDTFVAVDELELIRILGSTGFADTFTGSALTDQTVVLSDLDDTLLITDAVEIDAGDGNNIILLGDDTAARSSIVRGGAGKDTLLGNAQRNTLFGDGGDDLLEGAGAIDLLSGGLGDDIYVWSPGDGDDIIDESHAGAAGGLDTLLVGGDIAPEDVQFGLRDDKLVLLIGEETITIVQQDDAASAVETLRFSDGRELSLFSPSAITSGYTMSEDSIPLSSSASLSDLDAALDAAAGRDVRPVNWTDLKAAFELGNAQFLFEDGFPATFGIHVDGDPTYSGGRFYFARVGEVGSNFLVHDKATFDGMSVHLGSWTGPYRYLIDEGTTKVSISDASAIAGGVLSFLVMLDRPCATDVTIRYVTNSISTTGNVDQPYISQAYVTIPAGETQAYIEIASFEDTETEGNEIFHVNLKSISGPAEFFNTSAVGTIIDDELNSAGDRVLEATRLADEFEFLYDVTRSEIASFDVERDTIIATQEHLESWKGIGIQRMSAGDDVFLMLSPDQAVKLKDVSREESNDINVEIDGAQVALDGWYALLQEIEAPTHRLKEVEPPREFEAPSIGDTNIIQDHDLLI